MTSAGFVGVPVLPTFAGLSKEFADHLIKPAEKAGKSAGKAISDGVGGAVESLERQVKASQGKLGDLDRAYEKSVSKREQQNDKLEAATLRLRDAEDKYKKAIEKGDSGLAELARVQDAKAKVKKATDDLTQAEIDVTVAERKHKDQLDDLNKTMGKLDDAQKGLNKTVEGSGGIFDNFREDVRKAGAELDDTAEKSSGFGDKLMSGLGKIGTGALLGVGAKIGTTVMGGIDTAFSSGFGRLASIEQAETMLGGLGHSAEGVTEIMDNAMDSVSGTAYGFGEAASMAATFAGAGIEQGEELTEVLSLVGDSAAITGADFEEMGSIWTKMASSGRLSTDEMNQLMDRGLGLLPELQKHYNVTADEARKMVSDGEVSFQDFSEIMENMVGGSAQAMGDTFSGSAANMRAALGRLGAQFLDPIYENAPAIFQAIGGAVDKLGEHLGPLIEDFSERLSPYIEDFAERLGPWLEESVDNMATAVADLVDRGRDLIRWFQDNEQWILPLVTSVGLLVVAYEALAFQQKVTVAGGFLKWMMDATKLTKVWAGVQAAFNVVMSANPIALVVIAIAALVAGLVVFFTKTETGQEIWAKFTTALADGWDWVVEKLSAGWAWIQENVWDPFMSFLNETLLPLWDSVWGAVQGAWDGFIGGIQAAWENILQPVFNGIWELVQTTIAVIATVVLTPLLIAWNLLSAGIEWAWENVIQPVWSAISTFATETLWPILESAFTWIGEKWQSLVDALQAGWDWVRDNVFQPLIDFATGTLWPAIESVFTWISDKWSWMGDMLAAGWSWIDGNVIQPVILAFQRVWDTVLMVVDWIVGKWNWLADMLAAVWSWIDQNVFAPLRAGIQIVADWFGEKVEQIRGIWQVFQDVLKAGWDWVNTNVFGPIGVGLETVQGWFEAAVDGIGTIWDGLRAAAAKPVRFVIDTVWNKGILAAWNAIAAFLPGIDEKDPVPLGELGRYASGGVLPGYTPGRDVHTFVSPTGGRIHLSGGEAIMRPEWTRAVGGPAAVEAMNRAARAGRIDPAQIQTGNAHAFAGGGVWDLGHFASGGVLITTAIQAGMRDIVKAKYPNISLTSATRPGHSGYHGTGQATDWSNGSGNTPMQLSLAHDIAQTYPGSAQLIYAAPGWASNIYEGSPAGAMDSGVYKTAQAGRHDNHVHWAMTQTPTMQFGGGVFEGGNNGGGLGAAVVNWIADKARGIWDKIVGPIRGLVSGQENDSLFTKIPGAIFETLSNKAWGFLSGLFGAGGGSSSGSVDTSNVPADVVGAVETVFARHGFTGAEWEAAKWIIQQESSWNPTAVNPSSGAYGLFQFNPMGGNTLGAYLPDRSPDPAVQADAGARYMKDRYGSPSAAKAFWEQNQWYADGGITQFLTRDFGGLVPSGALVRNTSGRDELMLPPETTALFNRFLDEFPEVARALESAMDSVEKASASFEKAMDFTSMEGITARQSTRAVLGMGLDLPGADLISGVLDAEQTLWDGRARHIGHLTDIEDKQKALEEAQQRLIDLQGDSVELTTQQQRKLDDAQKAVDEAKAEQDKAGADAKDADKRADAQAKAAEKVSDAEEKLRRVREDLAEEGVKSEEKRAEEVEKAHSDIMKAETDLYEARKAQIMDLDHIVVLSQENVADWGAQANQLGGQLVQMGVSASMVAQGLGVVSGALGAVSAAAGPAGITLGMAFQALQIVIQLVQIIDGLIKEWLAGIAQVKIAQLDAMNDYLSNISQVTAVIHDQRSAVVELASTVVSAFIRMGDAARSLSAATAGVFQAGLDGAKNVADIQKQIRDLRSQGSGGGAVSSPIPWDMGLMYDSYSNQLTASPKVKASSQGTSLRDVVSEIAALNWDLQAALIDQQIMVKQAQIDQIRAEFEVLRSRLNLDRAFADLIQGVQRLEALERIQVDMAITEQQARIQQEINQLLIANAQAEQVKNDPLNRIGSFLDFDKDGKVFGIFDNMGSKAVQASESSIRANEKQIEALGKIMEQYGGSAQVSPEAIKAAEDVAYFMKEGREDLASMAQNGSPLGDAVRATQLTTLMQDLWAIDDRNESSRRALEDLGLDFQEYLATEPLQQEIDRLTHEREAYTAQAELMRASSEDVKLAAAALRDFHREAAAREPQVVTVNVPASGQTIDADDLAATINGLGTDISGLDFRVQRVESMNAPKGQAVISRKR